MEAKAGNQLIEDERDVMILGEAPDRVNHFLRLSQHQVLSTLLRYQSTQFPILLGLHKLLVKSFCV